MKKIKPIFKDGFEQCPANRGDGIEPKFIPISNDPDNCIEIREDGLYINPCECPCNSPPSRCGVTFAGTLDRATVGQPYYERVYVSGGNGYYYGLHEVGGTWPSWLDVQLSRLPPYLGGMWVVTFSGTPTAPWSGVVEVGLQDGRRCEAVEEFRLIVTADMAMQLTVDEAAGDTLSVSGTSVTVDWGDGSPVYTGAGTTHTYTAGFGTVTARVTAATGDLHVDGDGLTEVVSFGNLGLSRIYFQGAANLVSVPGMLPASITNMSMMFNGASSFNDPSVSSWDVSNVTDMTGMFANCLVFNQPLNSWDVSNVTLISGMFANCPVFNQPLNSWDTSSVTKSNAAFSHATAFNQDLSSWDTANIMDMSYMFAFVTTFNQDISNWDTSSAGNMEAMFSNATSFNQDLSDWCVTNITSAPVNFDTGASAWALPRPVWGTCPP